MLLYISEKLAMARATSLGRCMELSYLHACFFHFSANVQLTNEQGIAGENLRRWTPREEFSEAKVEVVEMDVSDISVGTKMEKGIRRIFQLVCFPPYRAEPATWRVGYKSSGQGKGNWCFSGGFDDVTCASYCHSIMTLLILLLQFLLLPFELVACQLELSISISPPFSYWKFTTSNRSCAKKEAT